MKTDNEIIAEFMGWESGRYPNLPNTLHRGIGPYERGLHTDHLKYDTSWDWLMPVVRQICDLYEQWPYEVNKVRTFGVGSDIHKVYNAVVEFIKWYNSVISPTGK